jgi:hypothetical protein
MVVVGDSDSSAPIEYISYFYKFSTEPNTIHAAIGANTPVSFPYIMRRVAKTNISFATTVIATPNAIIVIHRLIAPFAMPFITGG